jgi:hypothetical protein
MRVTLRASVPFLLLLACGGGSKDGTTTPGGGAGEGDQGGEGGGDGGAQALPEIPSSPAAMPATVLATFSIGNPKAQLADLSAYADAINPGMGAMIGANFLPSVSGIVGAPGLDGYDLSRPMHVLILDPKKGGGDILLVIAVADEQKLVGSVAGGALVQVHDGFAAIGRGPALVSASAYALSNLAKTQPPAHPLAVFHMNKIMDAYGTEVDRQLRDSMGSSKSPAEMKAADGMVKALKSVERIEAALQANAQTATATFSVFPAAGSGLAAWGTMQKPSDYTVAQRLPKAGWLMVAAGRIDLGPMAAFWSDLAAADGKELGQLFAAFGSEMAVGLWVKDRAVRVAGLVALKPGAEKTLATFLADYVGRMVKAPKKMDSMEVTAKLNGYRTGGAALHEITIKPGKDADPQMVKEVQATFGKGGIKSYFGVAGSWMVFALDKDKAARGLAAKSVTGAKAAKPKVSLDKVFADAVADSKSKNESGIMAFDLSQAARDPKQAKGAVVTVGLGFDGPVMRTRVTIPPATGKFIVGQMMGGAMAPGP